MKSRQTASQSANPLKKTSKSTGTEDKSECKLHEKPMRETSRNNQNSKGSPLSNAINHLSMEIIYPSKLV